MMQARNRVRIVLIRMTTNDTNRPRTCVALHTTGRPRTSGDAFRKSELMTFGTWLFTKLRGELVGTDDEGNRYYRDKRATDGRRRRRWVIYQGEPEASRVPPDWHGW